MSAVPERILVLADGSPAAESAVRGGIRIAEALTLPLAILGVSPGRTGDAPFDAALEAASKEARDRVASVEVIRETGDILSVAARRVAEAPTLLVVLGANPRAAVPGRRIAPGVWELVKRLAPPALVTRPGDFSTGSALFCTGGERFIEDGARLLARIAAALGMAVTVFHAGPPIPAMYGDHLRDRENSPAEFLKSRSRLARSVERQLEIFRAAGISTKLRLGSGDVVSAVEQAVAAEKPDLLVVGSSPARGALQTYMMGDLAREIVDRAGRSFLVLRSRQGGLLRELWRSLREGAATGGAENPTPAEGGGPGSPS